jgi:anti-anti-sigma regulatory factor
MQSETRAHVDQLPPAAGHPVAVLRFQGDIASTSKDAVLGTCHGIPKESSKLILLDFTKVDSINSSGMALVIQLLIEAAHAAQKIVAFGFSPHFNKLFTMVGITKYASSVSVGRRSEPRWSPTMRETGGERCATPRLRYRAFRPQDECSLAGSG